MSGMDQRTTARQEAVHPTTAVTDSTPTPAAVTWPAIDSELLAGDEPGDHRLPVPAFPLALLGL